jgi:hypothetical protein
MTPLIPLAVAIALDTTVDACPHQHDARLGSLTGGILSFAAKLETLAFALATGGRIDWFAPV